MIIENRNIVVQSNRMLQAKYGDTLSFWESFIMAKMCTMIHPNDEDFKGYTLYVKDLLENGEILPNGKAYHIIYEAAQRLLDRKITIRGFDENGKATITNTHIIVGIKQLLEPKKTDNSYFSLSFHPELKPFLLQLKKDFSIMQLGEYKKLHTHTAIRMYEILISFFGRGQKVVTLEITELKEMLGLQDKYERFEALKRKVIDDAQKRLADSTDYSFTYTVKKQGRTPHSVEFKIHRNTPKFVEQEQGIPTLAINEIEHISSEVHEKLFGELHPIVKGWGVGKTALMKLIESNEEEKIRAGIEITKQAEQGEKVKNIGGYFIKAVKEGYLNPAEIKQKKQLEKKEKIKAIEQKAKAEIETKYNEKKEIFERERKAFLTMMQKNPDIIFEIVEAMKKHQNPIRQKSGFEYKEEKSFAENWEQGTKSMQMAIEATAKELYPTFKK